MANCATISVVSFLEFIVLLVCICPSVYGGEVLPWGVERIHAHCVWDNNMNMTVDEEANAGQNISIGIIDTGIYYWKDDQGKIHYHEDLKDNVAGGRGFRHNIWTCHIEEKLDYQDYNGHGTHCAGIIGAVDNAIGVIGTAPKVKIYALQLYSWDAYEVAAAINWSVNNGIEIISISFQWKNDIDVLREACDYAYEEGLLLMSIAGDNGIFVYYPAKYDSVIAVGAVYPNDTRCEWSNTGSELEFVAPGVDVNSTVLNDGYGLLTGTSQACPHVAATAALIWNSKIDPEYDEDNSTDWSNEEVREKLQHLALDLGSSGRDEEYGYGLINAWATNQRPLGDINNDLTVNYLDTIILGAAWGSEPGDPGWDPRADINIDNMVNYLDSIIVGDNFGKIDP